MSALAGLVPRIAQLLQELEEMESRWFVVADGCDEVLRGLQFCLLEIDRTQLGKH